MSSRQRLIWLGLAVVVVIVAVIVIKPGSDDEKSSGAATVEVKDAKPVGGVQKLRWKKGETIDLTVKSDTADEVHFHGYDVHKDVAKGGSVQFKFPAKIDGVFVVELEDHKQQIAEVTVDP
jgi:FtsP/CotA-like multicopper oxidase with cupredoxin domain